MLKAAEASRWYGYIAVSLLSGLRTEEVRALRWEHVRFNEGPKQCQLMAAGVIRCAR